MEKKITHVTGNWAKIESAKQAVETLGNFPDNKRWAFWSPDAYKELVEYIENKDK